VSTPRPTFSSPSLIPAPASARAETPTAFVRAIAHAYALRGLDPAQALAQAQIAPALLARPDGRITALQMERLSDAAMRELDDEALGWFSRPLPWGSYGMLARASITAPHLGLAMARWCRHHGLLTQDVRLELAVQGDVARLTLHEARDLGALREFCHVSLLRNALGVACWLVDSRIPLLDAAFAFGAPPHADAYAVLFSAPARFRAAPTHISFDARYLALPLRRDEAALQTMLERALPLTVLQYRRDRLLLARVRQMLRSDPQAAHNADDLAARLNLSARTLHRQLKDEGASLQSLKDTVRRELATDLLQRSQRPIKQVALAAGFQNEKSFIRAFKGWTGMTPGEWRSHGGGGSLA
jgi:AraC-like DNA-binding protein